MRFAKRGFNGKLRSDSHESGHLSPAKELANVQNSKAVPCNNKRKEIPKKQKKNVAAAFLQSLVSDFFLRSEISNALHEDTIHELLLGTFGRRHV